MVAAILISIVLVVLTLCLHQASFVWLARFIPIGARSTHPGLYLLMLGVFAVHVVEILIYALGFYVAINIFEIGSLEGARASGLLGHFYASAVFYTSLGFGDVLPNGHLRFIVSIEALNGLLLIAWSAAFIFAVMGKSWHCFSGPGARKHGDQTKAKE
jgi:ion channel